MRNLPGPTLVLMSQAGTLVNERNFAAPIEADRQGVREVASSESVLTAA